MALPEITPVSQTNRIVLPATGTFANVASSLPFGIYAGSTAFISGATDQVAFVYRRLGGDVLDIEITEQNVYAAYEEAVLEYSYIVNLHQAKNALGNMLGNSTASFDQDGEISGSGPSGVALKYPKFTFQYSQRVADGIASEASVGGDLTLYSASFDTVNGVQDYDLQSIVSASVATGSLVLDSGDSVGDKKITIRGVYYRTPRAMWRFFSFYGGINVVGNLFSYGQYTDDSTFEVIPTWQNKLQAMAYEDSIYTRTSHYSYEIHNNKLRLYPQPTNGYPDKVWFRFTVQKNSWEESDGINSGTNGINNMNTLPFANIPYESINSIGKQWIRKFALAISKEMLGQVRGKLGNTVPIPGQSVSLNAGELLSQAKDEQDKLREELKTILEELTYAKLTERDANIAENATKMNSYVPSLIYVG